MRHTIEKFLTRATTLLHTSSSLEVCTQSYGPPKLQETQLWEFQDIWLLVLWPNTEYTIRGKVVASPKFGPWWILWVRVCLWFVCAPKCFNYALTNLLFNLCTSVWVNELLINLLSPIPKLQHAVLLLKWYEPVSVPQLLLLSLSSPLGS